VYALAESGEIEWQAKVLGPIYTLAVLDRDRIAVGDDAGRVTILDAGGQPVWQHDLGSRVTALQAWEQGLLVGSWDERLSFLGDDSAADPVRWQVQLGGSVSDIAVLPSLVLAATLEGEVRAFDCHGVESWAFDAGVPIANLGVVDDPERLGVLVGLQDGRLLALDAEGVIRWQQTLDAAAEGSPVWHIADLAGDSSPEIVAGTGGDSPLLAMLSSDGTVHWRRTVSSPVGAITTLDLDGDGVLEILAGLSSGEVQALDIEGRLRAKVHAGLSVWGLEPVGDGSALILADVVAWQLVGAKGPVGGSWLPPPDMLPFPPDPLPGDAEHGANLEGTGTLTGTRALTATSGEAILVFLGDIALGRSMEMQLARYGMAYPWQGLGSLLEGADLVVANLECVLTTRGTPLDKSYLIRAHPRWGQTLVQGGVDLVSLANNHALDFGQTGLEEMLDALETLEIAAVGAGRSSDEAHQPALFTLNGVRIAILGYAAARWNGSVDVPATDRLAWAEPSAIQADVRAIRDQVNLVVVLLHAGTEYAAKPSRDQVAAAHAAIDAGADLVVGHHPHVTQTVERYGGGLIVYSLGDTLFDIPRPAALRGHLLRVHVTGGGLAQVELWPFWIEDAIRPRLLDNGHGEPRLTIVSP
jgi:poly-gamma-glutamate synthesis protein (capsule biosynthesis protein)